MTLPDERYRAVMHTRIFLHELLNPKVTPKVPRSVRDTARWLLRHYPSTWDLQQASESSPHIFAEKMEDVQKMFMKYEQGKQNEDKSSQ